MAHINCCAKSSSGAYCIHSGGKFAVGENEWISCNCLFPKFLIWIETKRFWLCKIWCHDYRESHFGFPTSFWSELVYTSYSRTILCFHKGMIHTYSMGVFGLCLVTAVSCDQVHERRQLLIHDSLKCLFAACFTDLTCLKRSCWSAGKVLVVLQCLNVFPWFQMTAHCSTY